MYCKYCGKQFEPWKDKQGYIENAICPECTDFMYGHSKQGKAPKKRFCVLCGGNLTPNSYYKMPDGSKSPWWGAKKFCSECTNSNDPIKILHTKRKSLSEHSKQVHRENSRNWQKEHPEEVRASRLARYDKTFNTILYECPCDVEKKHLHHPDYRFPHIIIKLCPPCHAAEHKRLRTLNQEVAN